MTYLNKEKNMAKKATSDLAAKFMAISKKVDKNISEYGSTLKNSIYSNIDEYIDTGSYSLNRLITGDIYKGIPRGRVIALAGESGVGKSFVSGMAIKNAQQMGYTVIYYDSENAVDNDFMERIGVDTDNMMYFPIDVIEDFRNHAINTCKQYLDENPEEKVMIVLDSFGNLSCAKEKRDLEAGKDNSDMGARAKAGKSMLKEMTHFCGKYRVPFVFTNHTYKDVASAPNPMYAKDIQGGGRQATYMASAVIMLRKSIDKDENKKKKGSIIRMKSDKNRLARDEQQTEMYLSFTAGPNKYYGLLADALESGVMTKPSVGWYQTKFSDKKVREKELYSNKIFTKELLDELNEYCIKTYQYATVEYGEDTLADDLDDSTED
jgi:RecA/RadA recombinase